VNLSRIGGLVAAVALSDLLFAMPKVTLCHRTGSGSHTLTVAAATVPAHLAHGDYLGPCVASPSQ
jgi:hypothetical protein